MTRDYLHRPSLTVGKAPKENRPRLNDMDLADLEPSRRGPPVHGAAVRAFSTRRNEVISCLSIASGVGKGPFLWDRFIAGLSIA